MSTERLSPARSRIHRQRTLVPPRPRARDPVHRRRQIRRRRGGAYWLLDEIAIAQRFEKAVAVEEFQVWKLTVNPDRSAKLACEDGNGRTVFEKAIEYTDFPVDSIELWFENSTIYLPSDR